MAPDAIHSLSGLDGMPGARSATGLPAFTPAKGAYSSATVALARNFHLLRSSMSRTPACPRTVTERTPARIPTGQLSVRSTIREAAGWARISFVRDAPDGRRFVNDSRGFLYLLRDGKTMHELCLASPADAKIPAEDYETMQKMFDTMRKMASAVSTASMPLGGDIEGVPVKMKNRMDGSVHTLKQISTDTLPASLFALPPYKKVSLESLTGLP